MPFTIAVPPPGSVQAPLLPSADRVCRWIHRLAAIFGLATGISNLLAWAWQWTPFPHFMVMRVNTALAITAAALSLALWYRASPGSVRARIAQGCGALAALIGGLTAAQDLFGVDLGIDQLLAPGTFPGDLAGKHAIRPGRMSLNAALSLFFIGCAATGLDWCARIRGRHFCISPPLAVFGALPAALALVGYLLGVGAFTGMLSSTNVLLHTAAALFALSIGLLAARPERPPVRRILSAGAAGLLLRWTLPGTLALLLGLGWSIGHGRVVGYVAPGEGTALMLYGGIVLLFALLVTASRAVARQEEHARNAGHALQIGQERSRAIIATALDGVLLMDSEGRIIGWNPAAERIFGWRADEVLGQALADRIIPERLRSAHHRGLAHLLKTGDAPVFGRRLELSALRRDGAEFPVELSINPLPGTEPTLFVGFIRDITDRRAAEENLRSAKEAAESASRAKDNFLAALSHELRTPLAPVLMSAAALRGDARLPDDARGEMAMIERNISLEARLIDDLLDLTRIARGKLKLRAEHCDAHSLLTYAVEIVRDEADSKQVGIELALAARRSGLIGDPARLQQVFWNLLKNAVKFTPAGGSIQIKTRDADSERLVVEVTDTGIGFEPAASERVFEPFEQAGRENDHRFGGLGLGLAIARAIVDLHGGVIRAGSGGPGQGATFTVELTGAIEPPSGLMELGGAERSGPDGMPSLRLLVVDDHEPTLAVLMRLLTRAGHEVTPASSVASALAAAENRNLDAVISDLGLPDGTGLELIAKLREREPGLRSIALSGYGTEEDLLRSREAGFTTHLIKPVDFEQLRQALRDVFRE